MFLISYLINVNILKLFCLFKFYFSRFGVKPKGLLLDIGELITATKGYLLVLYT